MDNNSNPPARPADQPVETPDTNFIEIEQPPEAFSEPSNTNDDPQETPAPPTALESEIRALEEKLLVLRRQAASKKTAQDDRELRNHIRKARFGHNWVQRTEKAAEETSQERVGLGNDMRARSWPKYMLNISHLGKDDKPLAYPNDDYNSQAEFAFWQDTDCKPHHGIRPVTSLRPVYSRKVGPPSQWDAADGDEWSSDDSISSKDFDYFRARLRGDFEWELDRLGHQRARYQKHKEKKARLNAETEDAARDQVPEQTPGEDAGLPDNDGSRHKTISNTAINQLNPIGWAIFKSSRASPAHTSHVIDILVGEPDITRASLWGYSATKKATPRARTAKHQPATHSVQYDGAGVLPERIRINSKHLIKTLSMIRGSELAPDSSVEDSNLIMLRPFRMLAYYDKEIRDWCAKLTRDLIHTTTIVDDVTADVEQPLELSVEVDTDHAQEPADVATEDGNAPETTQNKIEDPEGLSKSKVALNHLTCLIEFQDKYLAAKKGKLRKFEIAKVSYSDIWHFFKPGDIVIGSDGKQAYQVVNVVSSPHKGTETDGWAGGFYRDERNDSKKSKAEETSIHCVYIDFDGQELGPVSEHFSIRKFDGEKEVVSLPVYPLHFHILKGQISRTIQPQQDKSGPDDTTESRVVALRQHLAQRGRKFVEVARIKHMYYAGITVDPRDEVEGQVMIDFEEAFTARDGWRPDVQRLVGASTSDKSSVADNDEDSGRGCDAACCAGRNVHDDSYVDNQRHQDFINNALSELQVHEVPSVAILPRNLADFKDLEDGLKEEELLIMSYRVFGFVLRDRTWAKLDLEYLTDVTDSSGTKANSDGHDATEDAFDQLVLDERHKEMVLSLVSQHYRNKSAQKHKDRDEQVDIVRGKGKGLIMLLHGAPGVGKTTTAEGVAEKFKKPLFQITCGDLGVDAAQVETALQTTFRLANRWGCILLLDEADVFLAERRREDFTRNGTVAVFLRILEYYAGILFLTTNRIGDFDEAFVSRIHMSLHYPPLDESSTIKVLTLNMDMIKRRYKHNGRLLEIEEVNIALAVGKYWRSNEKARWNGRQIRNACQTALALAEFDAQPPDHKYDLNPGKSDKTVYLKAKHLETVSQAYQAFIEYLKEVHGADAETHAKEGGLRAGARSDKTKHNYFHSFSLRDPGQSHLVPPPRQPGYGHAPPPHQEHYYDQQQPQQHEAYTTPTHYPNQGQGSRARQEYPQAAISRSGPPPRGHSPRSGSPRLPQRPMQGYEQPNPGHTQQALRQPHLAPGTHRRNQSYGQPMAGELHAPQPQHQYLQSEHGLDYPPQLQHTGSQGYDAGSAGNSRTTGQSLHPQDPDRQTGSWGD